jgi:hypothetical protein
MAILAMLRARAGCPWHVARGHHPDSGIDRDRYELPAKQQGPPLTVAGPWPIFTAFPFVPHEGGTWTRRSVYVAGF